MLYDSKPIERVDKINNILKLADEFVSERKGNFHYCLEEGRFYIYKDGYYKPLIKEEMELHVLGFENIAYLKDGARKQFIHNLGVITQLSIDKLNANEILNLENGVLHIKDGLFASHSMDDLSTIRIPYKYDSTGQCPTWLSFLNSSLEGDMERINILQEYMGYCLGKDNRFHKSLVLVGEGRNGKGTTFRVIEKLIGWDNCTFLKLGEMTKQENVSSLVNKLVNIDADTDTGAKGFESDFRRITAGDAMQARVLYSNPFSFKPFCKLIVGANELPRIADKTHGFYDRLIIIPFNVSFVGREDRELDYKLGNEISGILNWALEGRRRLYTRGYFGMTKTMEDHISELKMENNPIEYFIHNFVTFEEGKFTSKEELYNLYKQFCHDDGHHPFSKIKFGKEFFRFAGSKTQKDVRLAHVDARTHIWPSVVIKGKELHAVKDQITW